MKKIIALLLAMVLMAGVFTGCANTEEPVEENNAVLKIGDKKHRVKTGGSFCIHPTAPHCLINTGKRSAKVLWVSNPPSF